MRGVNSFMNKNLDNFCPMPWIGLSVNPQQEYAPCRQLDTTHKTYNHDDYVNGKELTELKQKFLNGERPDSCRFCYGLEAGNFRSLRQHARDLYVGDNFDTSEQDYKIIIYQLNGNSCNLACRTCDSKWSTAWTPQLKKAEQLGLTVEFSPHKKFYTDPAFNDQMRTFCSTADDITFAGGEPFMPTGKEEHIRLLTSLPDTVNLTYITNGTMFPDPLIIEQWKRMQSPVVIRLSIDAIGDRFDYLRYPAKWTDVEQNALRYMALENVSVNVEHTVSIFNILYLPESLKWCVHHKIEKPFFTFVVPDAIIGTKLFDCRSLPPHAKDEISKKLSHSFFKHTIEYLYSELIVVDEEERRTLIDTYDKIRNQSFKDTFPEIAALINYV